MIRLLLLSTLLAILGAQTGSPLLAEEPPPRPKGLLPGFDPDTALADEKESAKEKRKLPVDVKVIAKGDSSDRTRTAALRALPLRPLDAKARARADNVLTNLCMFRRLPVVEFESHPDAYQYFMQHPDVAVSIWRAMNISKFEMWQTGQNEYEADTKDGTIGVVDAVHRTAKSVLVVCEGEYRNGLLLKPVRARALLHLVADFRADEQGKPLIQHHLDMFVSFDSHTVKTAAKLVSPLSNLIVDRNFREVSLFAQMMSVAMERQPGWVERMTKKLKGVVKGRDKELLDVTARVYVAAQRRAIKNSIYTPTDSDYRPIRKISAGDSSVGGN